MGPTVALARWLPVAGWAALIWYWSGQSELPIDDPWIRALFRGQQHRLAHAAAFGTLAFLIRFALGGAPGAAWWAWLLAAAFGVVDEWHQSFTPLRTPDAEDVLIDALAAGAAALCAEALLGGRGAGDWRPARLFAPVAVGALALPLMLTLLDWHAPAPAAVKRRTVAAAHAVEGLLPSGAERYVERVSRTAIRVVRRARAELGATVP